MRHFKNQLNRLNVFQIGLILLIFGLFLGILFANLFQKSYDQQMLNYENSIFQKISSNEIDYPGLFRYVLFKNLSEFIIFWLLCITILGIPYMAYKITSFGFFTGFLISAVFLHFGIKGIVLILAYLFPHGLIYLPVAVLSLYKGYELCSSIYHDKRNHMSSLLILVKQKLAMILILAAALAIGCFLEAYAGAFLLKKALGMFI